MKVLHKNQSKIVKSAIFQRKMTRKLPKSIGLHFYVIISVQKLMTFFCSCSLFVIPLVHNSQSSFCYVNHTFFFQSRLLFQKTLFNFCSLLKYYKKPAFYQILYAFTKKSRFQFFFQKNARQPDRHENYHILQKISSVHTGSNTYIFSN